MNDYHADAPIDPTGVGTSTPSAKLHIHGGKPVDFTHLRSHRLKKLMPDTPYGFLIDLINSMDLHIQEWTEVYKNHPEMFEDELDITAIGVSK